jgi:hypothetical protein
MWVEAAMEPDRTGSTQKATKASIFPVVETVIEGRTTMIAMRIAVMTSRAYSKLSGDGKFNAMSSQDFPRDDAKRCTIRIQRLSSRLFLLAEFPNIANKLFDLIVSQLALVSRHFLAFAIRGGIYQLRVGLLLHVV